MKLFKNSVRKKKRIIGEKQDVEVKKIKITKKKNYFIFIQFISERYKISEQ